MRTLLRAVGAAAVAVIMAAGLMPGAAQAVTQTDAGWNLDRIDQADLPLDGAYSYPNSAGAGINVYVLSTGILVGHGEFANNRAKHGATICAGCSATDDNGDGTHLASIVAGTMHGVAKKARVIAVNSHNAAGFTRPSDLIAGMVFVLQSHQADSNKNTVALIGASLPRSPGVNDAVQALVGAGIHVVAPAGDTTSDACLYSPASAPAAITVAGSTIRDSRIAATNTGTCVDLFAPGRDIQGASIESASSEASRSGTRQAAAHVAGAIALIIAKSGNSTPAAMANTLSNMASQGKIHTVFPVLPLLPGTPNLLLRVPAP